MYKIYADETLIYDSTVDDYKIGKGSGSLESNKAGSFTFSVYPEHFFYDRFIKKRTVITVTKSDRILFRGRVLDDKVDMWKRKEVICEGELNFLQDSFIRPYTFNGTPEEAFHKFVSEHNAQVDEFKRFRIGSVTVYDPNNYITRSNSNYENALKNLTSRLLEDSLGGYLHISHGEDGKDPIPTIHYLADFTEISSQTIEFGSNLKDFLKTGTGQAIATAIIPLGAKIEDGNAETEDLRLTIAAVNDGLDYVYNEAAVAKHGWIFDTVIYDDVTIPANLKARGLTDLAQRIQENITLQLTAVDLHFLDHSIESFRHDTYVRVVSLPHNFAETLLCHRQTFDLLRPDNDSITLGASYSSFTNTVSSASAAASVAKDVRKDVDYLSQKTSQYKIAEQRLTSLLAQSFGVFKTEQVIEDGSTVFYMHDKPNLDDSMNIWKMTGDAFAVSSDGGQTWNAGLDVSGNAIMNVLSVIGIDASWINADNLTAISANLGGWLVDNDKIYKEIADINDPSTQYRVSIAPPQNASAGISKVLTCEKSTNSGISYDIIFSLYSNGSARFNEPGNSAITIRGDGFNVNENFTSFGKRLACLTATRGSMFFELSDYDGGTVQLEPTSLTFLNDRANYIGGISVFGGILSVDAGQVRSGDGLNMYFDFNDGFRLVFNGGILVDAYYI